MRKIICTTIILSSYSFAHIGSLYEARGFFVGKCYAQFAARICDDKGVCTLEVPPEIKDRLIFNLPTNSELIKNKKTTDYGNFEFKVVDDKSSQKVIAKIMSKKNVLLKDFDSKISDGIEAKEIKCKF